MDTLINMNTKVKYFFDKQIKVHIICSSNSFYNGIVIDVNEDKDFLVIMDGKYGETPILFEEIIRIEPFVEKEK